MAEWALEARPSGLDTMCMATPRRPAKQTPDAQPRGHRIAHVNVPDVRSDEFAAEARRQALRLAAADRMTDDQAVVDAISVGLDADE